MFCGVRRAVASIRYQLRRHESAPRMCCRFRQSSTYLGVYIDADIIMQWLPLWDHVSQHFGNHAACDEVSHNSQQALLTLIRAPVVSKVDCYCSLFSTGRNRWSPPQRCRPTRVLSETFRTHDAAPRSLLVANLRADTVPLLCFDVLLSQWHSNCRVADVKGRRHLLSSTIVVPPVRRSTLSDRAFPVAAPRAWNSLPSAVRAAPSLRTFRRELMTFLYCLSFVDRWSNLA